MIFLVRTLLYVYVLAPFLTVRALAQAEKTSDLKGRLEQTLKASSIPKSSLGLAVIDLAHTPQVEEFLLNAESEMIPASVTKLATAATVLHRLGPSFKFQTTLWSTALLKNGVLAGDLILKGGGDPGFVSETLWVLVNELVRRGVHEISGHVIVDDTDFDAIRNDPSRDPERVDRAYDAPVGAMSLNWNSVNVYVRPTRVGEPPQVYLDPLPDYFKVENRAKTTAKSGSDLQISRVGGRLVVHGTIGVHHEEVVAYKNIDDPADWAGHALVAFLAQRAIKVDGQVELGHKPESAKLLAKVDSKPVSQSVQDMLKFSNNYVAEMLTKDLAAQIDASSASPTSPASLDQGMKWIREELLGFGLNPAHFTLLNPSGLSRRNRMRARDLTEILIQAQRQFPTFAEFLTALPIAGEDGTLKKRFVNSAAAGWIRAKTGSLSGVVSLAGFAGRKDGGLRAFAFLFNGKPDQDDSVRHLFDALAAQLVQ